ncbi:MAG: dephospho-CoA kinase [Bacteroides sp.]|uniref:dephospho-CoA kinase n=1 Tax=Bacteroides sp. TaxID=29523 RepID=UPI002FC92AB8
MAVKIGITGGIGSGKSVVSRLLEVMNIPIYISDEEAKSLTVAHPLIRQELGALLGDEIYQGGKLNKTLLASYLFGHPDHARVVNSIIHPRVKEHFRSWVSAHNAYSIIGMESAILYESGFADEVDVVVMVYAPLEIRIARAMKRDGVSRELITKRIDSQMSDEVKRSQADFTIINDDERPLIPQVLELISFLSKNIHYLCPAKK